MCEVLREPRDNVLHIEEHFPFPCLFPGLRPSVNGFWLTSPNPLLVNYVICFFIYIEPSLLPLSPFTKLKPGHELKTTESCPTSGARFS